MFERVAGCKECVKQRTVGSGPPSVMRDVVRGTCRCCGRGSTWQRSGAGKDKGEWGKALP